MTPRCIDSYFEILSYHTQVVTKNEATSFAFPFPDIILNDLCFRESDKGPEEFSLTQAAYVTAIGIVQCKCEEKMALRSRAWIHRQELESCHRVRENGEVIE